MQESSEAEINKKLLIQDSSEDETWDTFQQRVLEENQEEDFVVNSNESIKSLIKEVGAFVAFTYDGKYYPGVIESFVDKGAIISAMEKTVKA